MELFQSLNEDTQASLKVRLPTTIDAVSLQLGVQDICPVETGIEKVLEYHRCTIIDWRYLHEIEGANPCYLPELDKILMGIVETNKETTQQKLYQKND